MIKRVKSLIIFISCAAMLTPLGSGTADAENVASATNDLIHVKKESLYNITVEHVQSTSLLGNSEESHNNNISVDHKDGISEGNIVVERFRNNSIANEEAANEPSPSNLIVEKEDKKLNTEALSQHEYKLKALYQEQVVHLQMLVSQKTEGAADFAKQIEAQVKLYKDDKTAELLAWAYYHDGSFLEAKNAFDYAYQLNKNIHVLQGSLFALNKLEDYGELKKRFFEHFHKLESHGLIKNVLPMLIGEAMAQKEYQVALNHFSRLEQLRTLSVDEAGTRAWAYFNHNDYIAAANAFEALYRDDQQKAWADGLIYSLNKLDKTQYLQSLADETGGVLKKMAVDQQKHETIITENTKPETNNDSEYKNYFRSGFVSSSRTGRAGILGLLDIQKFVVEGAWTQGRHEYNLSLEPFSLDAGSAFFQDPFLPLPDPAPLPLGFQPGERIGSMFRTPGQLDYVLKNPRTKHRGMEWSLGYRHLGDTSPYVELGQLYSNSAVKKQTMKWRLGLDVVRDLFQGNVETYRQPLRESLLSYIGMTDPFQGIIKWGQVSKTGAIASMNFTLPYRFSVSANMTGEERSGQNVKKNYFASAYVSLTYNLKISGFDYFSIAPVFRWERSHLSQLHYTIGHGGYFSPQRLYDWGLSGRFQTESGESWLLNASVYYGKQSIVEASAPYFPLAPNVNPPGLLSNNYLPTRNTELHGQIEVHAIYAMDDHVRVGIGGFYSRSQSLAQPPLPNVKDVAGQIYFTYHFDSQKRTLSGEDVPARQFTSVF